MQKHLQTWIGHVALVTAAVMTAAPTRTADKGAPAVAMFTSPLTAGRYTVTWKAMSKDGHVVNGTIAFTVGGTK